MDGRKIQIPKRIQKSFFTNFDMSDLNKLNKKEAAQVLKSAIYQFKKTKESFEKAGISSPAMESYFGVDKAYLKINPDDTRGKYIHEIQRMMTFFRSKTSTVEGTQEYWDEQEKRIFGTVDENGVLQPKKNLEINEHLTEEERKRFWSAYSEFMHQYKTKGAESNRIQQAFAQAGFWRKRKYDAEDFRKILAMINEPTKIGEPGQEFRITKI